MRRSWVLFAAALLLLLALPEAVWACPVCFDARDENRQAFLATTALLTLLPLGMVGGVGIWLRRRVKALDEADAAERSGAGAADGTGPVGGPGRDTRNGSTAD